MEQATFYTEFDQRRPKRLIIKVLGEYLRARPTRTAGTW